MQGLMQDWPLTVDKMLDHARAVHGATEIVTRGLDGAIVRSTYAQINDRARRLTTALLGLGVRPGDRVGTLAWNSAAHLEAWYGVMGMGAVCHTMNPRLLPSQLGWMADQAGDAVILADACFGPLMTQMLSAAPDVRHVVWLTNEAGLPEFTAPDGVAVHALETLLDAAAPTRAWGGFDEGTAAGLCYTSGTTGDPKGVLYSHRSNVLHALFTLQADVFGATARDTVLAVVPMFHANGWGLPFSAPATGAKLVMPGPRLDGASIHELIETEQVTFSAAVPTVWANLLTHLRETGKRIDSLKAVIIGGAAVNEGMVRAYQDEYGVEIIHAWGMAETSPLGTVSRHTVRTAGLDADAQMAVRMKQGRPPFGVELKVVGEAGETLPNDGQTFGVLMARGPAVAASYFRVDQPVLDAEGFFNTGDIATLDPQGFMQITDRAKDVIKSGGEWISSIEIENHVLDHPACEAAAVIGVPHPKWNERPVLLVKRREGHQIEQAGVLAWLEGRIAKWWMPDDVLFVDAIPLGGTGKVDKKAVRASLADYQLPQEPKPPVMAAVAAAAVLHAPESEPDPDPEAEAEAEAEVEAADPGPVEAAPAEAPEPESAPAPKPESEPAAVEPPVAPFPARSEVIEPEPEVIGPFPHPAEAPSLAAIPAAAPPPPRPLTLAAPKPSRSPLDPWRPRLSAGLRLITAAGLGVAVLTVLFGLLAPGLLDVAYRVEMAVLAFALIGLVCALALDWKEFGRSALIALLVAMIGLGCALILSAAWEPRGVFPEAAQPAA